MTYDQNITTTWRGAHVELRDKLSSMANWTLKEDSFSGSDYFVLTLPNGEDIRIDYQGIQTTMQYGREWNVSNGNWDLKYSNDFTIKPSSDQYEPSSGDSVIYYLLYSDSNGFVWYVERNVGDNGDSDSILGMASMTELWDYDSAFNEESDYTVVSGGGYGTQEVVNGVGNGSSRVATRTIDAGGLVNPDSNFGNYPCQEQNLVASDQYQNNSNNEAFIGTHNLWMRDWSGNDSAHRDTITGSGTRTYEILDAHDGSPPIAVRSDL